MKKFLLLGPIALFLLSQCNKNEVVPLVADFEATITGESPSANIVFTNHSTGAETYEWEFGEGSSQETSTDKSPSISVDKAGQLSVKLTVLRGSEKHEFSDYIEVPGNSAILEFNDVEFGLHANDPIYGRLFSIDEGKIFKDTEITSDNGPSIDLAFGSLGNTLYYFASPADQEFNVPNATPTKVRNYPYNSGLTLDQFDSMSDDVILREFIILGDQESFSNGHIPGIVLFQVGIGRIGAIKTKEVNSERIVVDIKVQKY